MNFKSIGQFVVLIAAASAALYLFLAGGGSASDAEASMPVHFVCTDDTCSGGATSTISELAARPGGSAGLACDTCGQSVRHAFVCLSCGDASATGAHGSIPASCPKCDGNPFGTPNRSTDGNR